MGTMAPIRLLIGGSLLALMASPAVGQFGVAGGKKRGTNFQDLNEMAKEQFDNGGLGLNSLDDFAGMNPSAMQELADLTPEKLAEQMQEAVNLFTSDSYFESALQNQEEILKNLEASGMVSEEDLEEFRANPTKLEEEMKAAVEQMKELFSDPEALGTAAQIAQGLTGLLTDPEKLAEA